MLKTGFMINNADENPLQVLSTVQQWKMIIQSNNLQIILHCKLLCGKCKRSIIIV